MIGPGIDPNYPNGYADVHLAKMFPQDAGLHFASLALNGRFAFQPTAKPVSAQDEKNALAAIKHCPNAAIMGRGQGQGLFIPL